MKRKFKYRIEVSYSQEDDCYIAIVPELKGCNTFGDTPEEAVKEVETAIELWIELAKEMGREIPGPASKPYIFSH
ncbi:MAG: hypothetical protein A3G93_00015 [Nitrospinae bacterium RIFCSPLOWO2_12_FULL_45_22]|nr:MAG: hypothetical protein A3G93_00015 [Nitrospinae bacterium RIFCSPLOWO2_12_FULL_45_22]